MIKTIVVIASILWCTNLFAQQAKPCQFIGLYDKNKRGICSDRAMISEEVKDYAEYMLKRATFIELHKKENPNTRFITEKESVIVYEYEKKISGWNCNSRVISIKTGQSINDCNKQLADQLTKYPNDFTTQPKTIFTWQGKALSGSEYSKDYGGLTGKFITANTGTRNIIVAKFTNRTADKLATVLLRTDDGKMWVEYVYPGNTLTKKYDAKKLEVQTLYQDDKTPKPSSGVIDFVKGLAREALENEDGVLKIRKWDPACMCVRG